MSHIPLYALYQDGGHYNDFDSVQDAVGCGEVFLGGCDQPTTFTVENEDRYILASLTNRRIVGVFVKQEWDVGGKYAREVGTVEFDATNHVLLMEHAKLVELTDNSEESDFIGCSHLTWNGPFCFRIVNSICEYFGVNDVRDITPEQFAFARQLANPQPPVEHTVTMTVTLKMSVQPGADLAVALDGMDYSFTSNTLGVVLLNSKLSIQEVA